MKITHTETGQSYHLKPGTQLEVERTNLFFNEWGEQTIPVELPDTDDNRAMLGYPDKLANKKKPPTRIPVTIEDGDYFMPCRQAILEAQRKAGISTSFYMNEGSFLSKISETSVKDIFGDETVPGVKTVAQGIGFCKRLLTERNEVYAIFPVLIDMDGQRKYINRVEFMDAKGEHLSSRRPSGGSTDKKLGFFNEFQRNEEVDGYKVSLDPGYYISPFLRAGYVLRRIFSHFGYTLLENFFDSTHPFSEMVFLNSTMDSLVNGTIMLAHLVPDCKCNTILNVYRKKFCCEFIPDEVAKTVKIEMFNSILSEPAEINLSSCLTKPYKIKYIDGHPLKISSQSQLSDGPVYDSVSEIRVKHPGAYLDPIDGAYYHRGYTSSSRKNIEKIACSTMPYYAGGSLKPKEITVPDCAVTLVQENDDLTIAVTESGRVTGYRVRATMKLLFIGSANALNSTLKLNVAKDEEQEDETSDSETTSKNKEQAPMLAFTYMGAQNFYMGTTTNYSYGGKRLSDYSLHYNGPDGIFERFYRAMDDLSRNSLNTVNAEFLLTQWQKMNIPAHKKIILDGCEVLIDKLKYSIGGKNEPIESELLTVSIYEPADHAPKESERFPDTIYEWRMKKSVADVSQAEYESALNVGDSLPAIYPPPPTEAIYNAGGQYYPRDYYYKYKSRITGRDVYERITVYLYPAKKTDPVDGGRG